MIYWTEKYAPKKLNEIVGQEKGIKELKEFVENFKPGSALLIYGPPGVGKTASVRALANEYGYDLLEVNASDERSSQKIRTIIGTACKFQSLFGRKRLVLIDEIDGMSARGDRGGIREIIRIIKESKVPIILIANDPWERKLAPLRRLCKLVKFDSISPGLIVKHLIKIAKSEGIFVDYDVLREIARRARGDLRAAINDLQTLSIGKKVIKKEDLTILGYRDKEISIFQALGTIFKSKSIRNVIGITSTLDIDIPEFILWIEENIGREYERLDEKYKAMYYVSRADQFHGRTIKTGNWRFLYVYSVLLATMGVLVSKREPYRKFTSYKRPEKLKKLKELYEKRQIIRENVKKIAKHLHESTKEIMNVYAPFFKFWLRDKKTRREFARRYDISESFVDLLTEL